MLCFLLVFVCANASLSYAEESTLAKENSFGDGTANIDGYYKCELQSFAGRDRYDTLRMAIDEVIDKVYCNPIVLFNGDDYADGVLASGFAGLFEGSVVMTNSTNLKQATKDTILTINPSIVYVIGNTSSISKQLVDQVLKLFKDPPSVERLYGANREETAIKLYDYAKNMFEKEKDFDPSQRIFKHKWERMCVITAGWDLPEAISITPYCYSQHVPVFFTRNGLLKESAMDKILKDRLMTAIVIGGDSSVSIEEVEDPLKYYRTSYSYDPREVIRLEGDSRFTACEKIIEYELKNGVNLHCLSFASGHSLPDGLSAITYCGVNSSVLALIDTRESQKEKDPFVALKRIVPTYTNPNFHSSFAFTKGYTIYKPHIFGSDLLNSYKNNLVDWCLDANKTIHEVFGD